MHAFDWLLQDLRYGLRTLWKDRRLASIAILTLALGIGATTVVFAAIYDILIDPLPYPNPEELVSFYIHDTSRPKDRGRLALSVPEFEDYREQNHVFKDMVGIGPTSVLYTRGDSTPQIANGAFVTSNTFELLGLSPFLGRPITIEDGNPGAAPVFAMTYRMWNAQFNGDQHILGAVLTLNGVPRTLVAVMPPRFLPSNCDIFIPFTAGHSDINNRETGNAPLFLTPRGRLKPGMDLKAVAADLEIIAQHLAPTYPRLYPQQFTILTVPLSDTIVFHFKYLLYTLSAAVILLLLIACSNVANLLLARATVREKEIAIRASLGATRSRLIRQLLVEGFVLSMAGCIVGYAIAYAGMSGLRALVSLLPSGNIPVTVVFGLDWRILLFAIMVGALTTLLCALMPAIHAARGALYTRMVGTGKSSSGGFRHANLRSGLVVIEIALSIILLTGTGLMMRSLLSLESVNLGFNPSNVLYIEPVLPRGQYDTAEKKRIFFQQLLGRVTEMPGVVSATESIGAPPYGTVRSEVTVPGKTHSEQWTALSQLCSESYFQTFEIPLLQGRLLSKFDVDSARRVAVINQVLARSYFKDEDPIGKTIKFNVLDTLPDTPHDAYFEVIGVVRDIQNQGLQESPQPEAFLPYTVTGSFDRSLVARTASDPLTILPTIRRDVSDMDSNIALGTSMSLESLLQRYSYAVPKFGLYALGVLAIIGLVLVIIGVFSVMSYSVSVQTHEIGVRMALGAQRGDILLTVIKQGLRLIGAGIVIGLVASFALTRLLASQIWGVSAADPLTYAAVVTVVIAVGIAACVVPARRATRVDPVVALRYE